MSIPKGAGRWVVASGNRGKLEELRVLLHSTGVELVAQDALGVVSPEETGSTFIENAILKARHACRETGLPAIADDSGLVVDALHGAPGVRSARFAGPQSTDEANLARLLAEMTGVPPGQRSAHFHCVLVVLGGADDPAPEIAQGRWHGEIALEPRGGGGFGYDPVFFDRTLGATAAEIAPEVKNRVSHRGQAIAALLEQLSAR